MSVLLTGGTGRLATLVASDCDEAGIPYVIASRKGQNGVTGKTRLIKFDWFDESTFEAPFKQGPVRAVLLIAPDGAHPADQMNPFIDLAVKKGVKRFILVAGSLITKGGHWLGAVWGYLDSLHVEYSVLKPVWFLENLLSKANIATIGNDDRIYSACGVGKAALLSVRDVASVAFKVLENPAPLQEELLLLGSELICFNEIASRLGAVLGRNIEHVNVEPEVRRKGLEQAGFADSAVDQFLFLESLTAQNKLAFDPRDRNDVLTVLGRPPTAVEEWMITNKAAFTK